MVPFETGSIDKLRAATATRFPVATEFAGSARSVLEMTAERDGPPRFFSEPVLFGRHGKKRWESDFAPATWEVRPLDGEFNAHRGYVK